MVGRVLERETAKRERDTRRAADAARTHVPVRKFRIEDLSAIRDEIVGRPLS